MEDEINQMLEQKAKEIRSRGLAYTPQKLEVDMKTESRFFRAAFLKVEPRFDVSKTDKDILNSLFGWVWRTDSMNTIGLDYDKGLFLHGGLGLGKSMTMLALRQYMLGVRSRHPHMKEDYRLGAWMKSASELANIYASDGLAALSKYSDEHVNLVIDEFGREPNPAKYFGTEMNVMQFLLQLRYDHRRSSITHITTNMHPGEITENYGTYVADRCLEMFNFIEFKGESNRR